jgi:hypothetical protein
MVKKLFLILMTTMSLSQFSFAQVYEKGSFFTSAGIILGMREERYVNVSSSVIGTFMFDYSFGKHTSIGGILGRSLFDRGTGHFDNSMTVFATRLGFHANAKKNLDPYLNLTFGFVDLNPSYYSSGYNIFGISFGTRYIITQNLGIYADFGIGASILSFGLVDKF